AIAGSLSAADSPTATQCVGHTKTRPEMTSSMQRCETLLAVLLLSSCRCGADLEQLHAVIAVDPDHIDFSAQDVGKPTTALFQVGNRGTGALTVSAVVAGDAFRLDAAPDRV